MKDKLGLLSPLFLKYQAEYEKNPRSRVFAPLAEMYRKVGMVDKSMEILAQGIRQHPTYVLGYLGMSQCYYDIQQFSLAYNTLKPFVQTNRDNLKLQRLYADICLSLDRKEEALDTFKYLLFMLPKEKELAGIVAKLEDALHNIYKPIHNPIKIPENSILNERRSRPVFGEQRNSLDFDADSWIQLPLNENQQKKGEDTQDPLAWEMKKSEPVLLVKEEKKEDELKIVLDLEAPKQKTNLNVIKSDEPKILKPAAPIITHTLVDLYIGQGHIEKALELLEKILVLNPDDTKTHEKILEINQLLQDSIVSSKEEELESKQETLNPQPVNLDSLWKKPENISKQVPAKNRYDLSMVESEEDGHKALMQEISQVNVEKFLVSDDVKKNNDNHHLAIVKKREVLLNSFLSKIKNRADKFKNL